MKYRMAPIWLANFLENDNVSRTRRDRRCLSVLLKRSIYLVFRACNSLLPRRRNQAFVGFVLIRMKPGLLAIRCRDLGPQRLSTFPTAIPRVEGNHLTGLGIHGDPDPLLVGSLSYEAPHLVGFGFSLVNDELGWPDGRRTWR